MGSLVRGFKTWAERTAASIRAELDLPAYAPLTLEKLAEFLDVVLLSPNHVAGLSAEAKAQLLVNDVEGWSAVACTAGDRRIVIFNPAHSFARRSSDIAHELAHILLDHEPGKMVISQGGEMVMRNFDQTREEEADWLGWSLLLPREALVHAARLGRTREQIAREFRVSRQLVEYRMRMTGVDRQFRRPRKADM